MPLFSRYIGIDYSGAETMESRLPGLRVYSATPSSEPVEICTPEPRSKYWTRQSLARWLADTLLDNPATLVGIDHAFSFPLRYFKEHQLVHDWVKFLEDFETHWPTNRANTYVDFIRDGLCGRGPERSGQPRWRRLCDVRARGKSVFHFDVPGSVAKATHAGLPWLRYVRDRLGEHLHFWPFDGWVPPEDQSVIAEIYPALWKKAYPKEDRNPHQHDAYTVARWMREADASGDLVSALHPSLTLDEKKTADIEGWILGLGADSDDTPKKTLSKTSRKTPARKGTVVREPIHLRRARERLHEIADGFHGKLITPRQARYLEVSFGSLDDTLDAREVLSFIEAMPPDFSNIPREDLLLVEIDRNFKIRTYPPPPFPHNPDEYCRRHPRR